MAGTSAGNIKSASARKHNKEENNRLKQEAEQKDKLIETLQENSLESLRKHREIQVQKDTAEEHHRQALVEQQDHFDNEIQRITAEFNEEKRLMGLHFEKLKDNSSDANPNNLREPDDGKAADGSALESVAWENNWYVKHWGIGKDDTTGCPSVEKDRNRILKLAALVAKIPKEEKKVSSEYLAAVATVEETEALWMAAKEDFELQQQKKSSLESYRTFALNELGRLSEETTQLEMQKERARPEENTRQMRLYEAELSREKKARADLKRERDELMERCRKLEESSKRVCQRPDANFGNTGAVNEATGATRGISGTANGRMSRRSRSGIVIELQ